VTCCSIAGVDGLGSLVAAEGNIQVVVVDNSQAAMVDWDRTLAELVATADWGHTFAAAAIGLVGSDRNIVLAAGTDLASVGEQL